jgi:hypothetical protein
MTEISFARRLHHADRVKIGGLAAGGAGQTRLREGRTNRQPAFSTVSD